MFPVSIRASCKIGFSQRLFPGDLLFLNIAYNVIFPIFLVLALGYLLAKNFKLDLGSLSKLNFYIFIPVFMFYSLLIFKPGAKEMADTILFNILLACATFLAMAALTRWLKFSPDLAAASTLGVIIFNSANYGIPVVQLAYQGKGVAIQVITITAMNVLTYTFGILIAGGWSQWRKGLNIILRLPILYALAAALLIRAMNFQLPSPLMTPLEWTSQGMLPIALLTLGAQLGQGGISLKHSREIWIAVSARLLFCPLLAFGLIHLLGIQGMLARVLFVSSSFPTAVATVLFAIEYDKEPAFTADLVFLTTLFSAITVTGAISLSATLF